MKKLNKDAFAHLLKKVKKDKSIREVAKEIGISPMTIVRVLNREDISVTNFIYLIEYIQKGLLWSFDSIFAYIME